MSTSESSRLECGCGKTLLFGFQLTMEGVGEPGHQFEASWLYHADGTDLCETAEPEHTRPEALWPAAGANAPILRGDPALIGIAGPAMQPLEPRKALAEARLRAEIEDYEERDNPAIWGVLLLMAMLVALVVICGVFVYAWWPVSAYPR